MKTLFGEKKRESFEVSRIDMKKPFASIHIKERMLHVLQQVCTPSREIILLCIGTDRSTGDSFGPLIGTELKKYSTFSSMKDRIAILGDIEQPVHAINLEERKKSINQEYIDPFIIAIDAGLGRKSSVGTIEIKQGPLRPGSGVNKDLGWIGDMHITGYVNIAGYMEHFVLQSTRLSLVMEMANLVASALFCTFKEWRRE